MGRTLVTAVAFTIFLVSLQSKIFSQTAKDLLLNLNVTTIADSSLVDTLTKVAQDSMYTNVQYSLSLCVHSFDLSQKIEYKRGRAVSLALLGEAFTLTGNPSKGLESSIKAVDLAESYRLTIDMAYVYAKCGAVYHYLGDDYSAITYYRKSHAVRKSNKYPIGLMGEAFNKLNMYDSALYYSQRCYEMDISDSDHWGRAYLNLAEVHARLKHYTLALEYFRTTLGITPVFTLDVIAASLGMASVFKSLGQKDSTLFYTREAIHLAEENKFPTYLISGYGLMKDVYKSEGKLDSAFVYQELMINSRDSIFAAENLKKIENLKFADQVRQIESEEAGRQAVKSRNDNLQYAGIGIGLITFIVLFLTLSNSIMVSQRFVRFSGIIALLLVFEFINLFCHPFIGNVTGHSPFWMFLILVCIAALLAPLHTRLEKWITHQLVEKNKKIRVATARKILEENEKPQ